MLCVNHILIRLPCSFYFECHCWRIQGHALGNKIFAPAQQDVFLPCWRMWTHFQSSGNPESRVDSFQYLWRLCRMTLAHVCVQKVNLKDDWRSSVVTHHEKFHVNRVSSYWRELGDVLSFATTVCIFHSSGFIAWISVNLKLRCWGDLMMARALIPV